MSEPYQSDDHHTESSVLVEVPRKEWDKHCARLTALEDRERVRVIVKRILIGAVVFAQGGIAWYLHQTLQVPSDNARTISQLARTVEGHVDNSDIHMSYERKATLFVPRTELQAKLESINGQLATMQGTTSRLESKLDRLIERQ